MSLIASCTISSKKTSSMGRLRAHAQRAGWHLVPFCLLLFNLAAVQGQTPQDGQVLANRLTLPRAGVWMPGAGANSGHWWQPDSGFGFCRLDPAPLGSATPLIVSAVPNACSTAAKSGGLVSVGTPNGINGLPANAKLIFVPDGSSKSVNVVRFTFNPATETISVLSTFPVTNVTAVGGGKGGGRPLAAVLGPNGRDLYVGYKASGDIMMVPNATSNQPGAPVKIGATSDGKGINAMTFFNNDLYLTESGGPALTIIPDPSGVTRAACNPSAPCTAHVAPNPGGLPASPNAIVSDGGSGIPATNLYIGDSPLNGTAGMGIVRWNVGTGSISIYSQSVTPGYNGQIDNSSPVTSFYTTYADPIGLALHPNGDLYVADDPSVTCAGACTTPALLQGHLWKVPAIASPPVVTAISPASGVPEGGTALSISGTGFSATPITVSVSVGGVPATSVSCVSAKVCNAVTPVGVGAQHVTVTVGGQTSATSGSDLFTYLPVTVTGVSPSSGPTSGNTVVTVTGTGFGNTNNLVSILFGNTAVVPTNCNPTSCIAVTPAGTNGAVDVRVVVNTLAGTSDQSITSPADLFTFTSATTPTIANLCVVANAANPAGSCSGTTGVTQGGSMVRITGTNLATAVGVTVGSNVAAGLTCNLAGTSCTLLTPPSSTGPGIANVLVTTANGDVSLPATFNYATPSASVDAFGITAPKGGVVWVPGALGGHWWSSDHANGFCRLDPTPNPGPFAINYGVCDDGSIGSPGQAAYDPRTSVCTAGASGPCHYIYVPDNAVKSTAVWRLTFDSATEKIVGAPEAMLPLADVRTLKPNGLTLGPSPDGTSLSLYITDLTELNIRRLDGPEGDPRLQTLKIIGTTGDGRGANGTIAFLGSRLYISENRAASWLDVSRCIDNVATPCSTAADSASTLAANPLTGSVPLPNGVFIAGVATDPIHNLVYAADSPGGSGATIWRYNPVTKTTSIAYLNGGLTPNPGTSFACALTCTRLTDNIAKSTAFSFAFGIVVDPLTGDLFVTEDATAGNRSGRGRAWLAPFLP